MARILIGTRLRDRRKTLGITQTALAAQLGISASYLNLIEGNRRNIGGALLKRIADALQVPIDEFDGAVERRLVDDLGEAASDPLVAALQLSDASAAELASRHPGWARAMVQLHRAYLDRSQVVTALSDRLTQDPFLGDAVHSLLTHLSAVRSASEILESEQGLDDAQRRRFVSIIASDSRRLSDVSQALAGFFTRAHSAARSTTPVEEVDDFIAEHDNHFPTLEAAADDMRVQAALAPGRVEAALAACLGTPLPSASEGQRESTRRFRLAQAVIATHASAQLDALLAASSALASDAARQRARSALTAYGAAAMLMPYAEFLAAARSVRYDVGALARRFDCSLEQVCHRLVTLRRPGAEGVRFGFLRSDPSGHVTKRLPLPRLPLPRYGTACPLWAVYRAFQAPGTLVRQLAEFPAGDRYLLLARTVEKVPGDARVPRHLMSIMLVCDALHADQLAAADGLDLSPAAPAVPVGQACRVCVRRGCSARQEDPIIDAGLPAG